jgi:hypothetical protein
MHANPAALTHRIMHRIDQSCVEVDVFDGRMRRRSLTGQESPLHQEILEPLLTE